MGLYGAVDLPDDPVSLSFWVASNLALRKAERLALFLVDNALLRLHMESQHIKKVNITPHSPILQFARNILAAGS